MDNSYKGIYKGFYKKRARKNERQALWTVEARTAIPPTLSRDPSGVRFALSPAGERGVKQPQAWTPPGYKSKADLAVAAADRAQVVQELERARLTDQVGELKAALYKRAEAPPAVVVNPSPAG